MLEQAAATHSGPFWTARSPAMVPLPEGSPPRRGRHLVSASHQAGDFQPTTISSSSTMQLKHFVGPKFLGWHPGTALDATRTGKDDGSAMVVRHAVGHGMMYGSTFSEGFAVQSPRIPNLLPTLMPQPPVADRQAGGAAAVGPRAMWSDADQLRSSDGFDMKKWRAEFTEELAKAGRKTNFGRPAPQSNQNEPVAQQAKVAQSRKAAAVPPRRLSLVEAQTEEYFLQQDRGAIIRDDVGSGLAMREEYAKQNAKRARQLIDDTGHMQRQKAAQRRSLAVNRLSHRAVVFHEVEEAPETEISDSFAREERITKTIRRIQGHRESQHRPSSIERHMSSTAPSHMSSLSTKSQHNRALKSRIKFAVNVSLGQQKKQEKRMEAVRELRKAKIRALSEREHMILLDAHNYYSKDVHGSNAIQVFDLPHCLMEAGLLGVNCSERWSIDRVCKEIVFALTLENLSLTKLPPIGSFRGSLMPKTGDSASRRSSLLEFVGPTLERLRTVEDVSFGAPSEFRESRQSFSALVANKVTMTSQPSGEAIGPLGLATLSLESKRSLRSAPAQPVINEIEDDSDQMQEADEASHSSSNEVSTMPSNVEGKSGCRHLLLQPKPRRPSAFQSRFSFHAPDHAILAHLKRFTAESLWQTAWNSNKKEDILVGASQALIAARKFMVSRPISFEDFAVEIVPAVRTELMEIRKDRHFDEFMKVLEGGPNAVCLSVAKFERLAKRFDISPSIFERIFALLPEAEKLGHSEDALEVIDGEARNVVNTPRSRSKAKEAIAGLVGHLRIKRRTVSISGEEPAKIEEVCPKAIEDPRLAFENVHEMLTLMQEQEEYEKRANERRIMKKLGLSSAKFEKHRRELVRLCDYFELYDADHSGYLSQQEVKQLLKHLGFQPYKPHESDLLDKLFHEADSDGLEGLDFNEFLDLMIKVREYQKTQRHRTLQKHFRAAAGASERLEIDSVDAALLAVGVGGKTTEEQDLQRKVIYDWDVDNSGDISFEEFADMCQRIQERQLSIKMDTVIKTATSLGIDRHSLSEYLWAFDQHDANGSDGLGMEEIHVALSSVTIRAPTTDELEELFSKLDISPDQEVPLLKYLELMQIAATGRGMFARELPFTLRDVPVGKLREVLSFFPLAESYIRQLDMAELIELTSSYLNIRPDVNMREEKEIGNVKQLVEYARREQLKTMLGKGAPNSGAPPEASKTAVLQRVLTTSL